MSDSFSLEIQIEDAVTGEVLGYGPLESVSRWSYTARFDRAGDFSLQFDGSDPQAELVQNLRIARARALLDGVWTEVGAGIIDLSGVSPASDGATPRTVSGLDLIEELSYREVGDLEVGEGTGATREEGLNAIAAFAPSGWTFVQANPAGHDYIYARYNGESVLSALIYLAEKTESHFYRSADRTLVFTSQYEDSGIRAISAEGELADNECNIESIVEEIDTHQHLTRIRPYGSGTGRAQLTLWATNRTAPSGYTLNKTLNYIQNDIAVQTWGIKETPRVEYKEITPIANTAANVRAACNMLFDSALADLQRRSTLEQQRTYTITVSGCSKLLRPLQTMRVTYYNPERNINVDRDLYILETTWEGDTSGIATTRLVVSTDIRWPETESSAGADRATQGRVFRAHPQMGPNSYWENGVLYVGSDQANHIAEFPFVLGPEVVTVERVRFRFKVAQVLSFTSTVAGTIGVAFDVTVDDIDVDVSVSGTIDISHQHGVPDHEHEIIVTNAAAPSRDIGASIVSSNILLHYDGADGGDKSLLTIPGGSDVTDTQFGGSTSLALSGTGTGTGTGTGGGELDLSDAIGVAYGVYRAPLSRTYDISDLEISFNSSAWIDMDTAIPVGDYSEFDVTPYVQDPDTFRPLDENNLIEIRRKGGVGTIAIDSSQGDGNTVGVSTTPEEHGLSLGEQVTISGTTNHDGTWLVVEITNEFVFRVNLSGDSNTNSGGTLEVNKAAMLLCKLGVVTSIQAIGLSD